MLFFLLKVKHKTTVKVANLEHKIISRLAQTNLPLNCWSYQNVFVLDLGHFQCSNAEWKWVQNSCKWCVVLNLKTYSMNTRAKKLTQFIPQRRKIHNLKHWEIGSSLTFSSCSSSLTIHILFSKNDRKLQPQPYMKLSPNTATDSSTYPRSYAWPKFDEHIMCDFKILCMVSLISWFGQFWGVCRGGGGGGQVCEYGKKLLGN